MPKPVSLATDCSTQQLLLGALSFIMVSYDMNLPTSQRREWSYRSWRVSLNFLILHTKELPIDGRCWLKWAWPLKIFARGTRAAYTAPPLHQILDTPLKLCNRSTKSWNTRDGKGSLASCTTMNEDKVCHWAFLKFSESLGFCVFKTATRNFKREVIKQLKRKQGRREHNYT